MTDVTADFEAGTLTNTISTGDPGSATAWDSVVIAAGGGTATYDNTHVATGSTKAAKLVVGGSSGATYLHWLAAFPDQTTTHYGRFYYYATANPSGDQIICAGIDTTPNTIWRIYHASTANSGVLRIADGSGTIKTSGSVAVGLNQWVRVEFKAVQSATVGGIEVKLFNSPDSVTADETFASAFNWNTNATCSGLAIGQRSNEVNRTIWIDDIDAAAAAYPGPAGAGGGLVWNKLVAAVQPQDYPQLVYGSRAYSGYGSPPADWTATPTTGIDQTPVFIVTHF